MRPLRLLLLLGILAGPLVAVGVLAAPVLSEMLASLPPWPWSAAPVPEQGLPGHWRIEEVTVNGEPMAVDPAAELVFTRETVDYQSSVPRIAENAAFS